MFGAEKNNVQRFEFDLEKELKADGKKWQETVDTADRCLGEIKNALREGTDGEVEELGLLMHGYAALQKVLKKCKHG